MAASPTSAEQLPSADADPEQEHANPDAADSLPTNIPETKADDIKSGTDPIEDDAKPSTDIGPSTEAEIEAQKQLDQASDENITFGDLRSAVDEIDENLDDAFGQAADSFWSFATTVTGKVSSVVTDQQGLETLRQNVTSRLTPLGNISRDIQTQIGTFAPNEKSITSLTDSVQKVAQTVQRNAVAMEEAILARANDVSDATTGTTDVDGPAEIDVDDTGVAIMPETEGAQGLDGISKVGESVSSAIEQTVGGLWSGLLGLDGNDEYQYEEKTIEMPKTRFGKRIFELQANPDTYCEPAEDLDAFEEWGKDFNLDNYESECIELLHTHDSIAELYERVVPRVVEEDTFWMRYFFAKHSLELEEERRQKLLERAKNAVEGEDDEDGGWGDDDWGDDSPEDGDGDAIAKESTAKGTPAAVTDTSAAVTDTSAAVTDTSAAVTNASTATDVPETVPEPSMQQSEEPAQKSEVDTKTAKKTPPRSKILQGASKEAEVREAPKDQVAAQDGDDDWGNDDWE